MLTCQNSRGQLGQGQPSVPAAWVRTESGRDLPVLGRMLVLDPTLRGCHFAKIKLPYGTPFVKLLLDTDSSQITSLIYLYDLTLATYWSSSLHSNKHLYIHSLCLFQPLYSQNGMCKCIYDHGSQTLIAILGSNSSAKAEQPQVCKAEQCQNGQACDCCPAEAQERKENHFSGLARYAR